MVVYSVHKGKSFRVPLDLIDTRYKLRATGGDVVIRKHNRILDPHPTQV